MAVVELWEMKDSNGKHRLLERGFVDVLVSVVAFLVVISQFLNSTMKPTPKLVQV